MKCDAFALVSLLSLLETQGRWALCLAVFITIVRAEDWLAAGSCRRARGQSSERTLGSVQLVKIPFPYFPSSISDTLGDIGLGDGVQSQPSAGCGAL